MDDLSKLLENAGVCEAPQGFRDAPELNNLSEWYEFEINDNGQIDVYTQTDDGNRRIARFHNFDDMLHDFGKM